MGVGRRGGARRDRSRWVLPFPQSPVRHIPDVASAAPSPENAHLEVPDGFMQRWVLAWVVASALASVPRIVRWALGLVDFVPGEPVSIFSPSAIIDSVLAG